MGLDATHALYFGDGSTLGADLVLMNQSHDQRCLERLCQTGVLNRIFQSLEVFGVSLDVICPLPFDGSSRISASSTPSDGRGRFPDGGCVPEDPGWKALYLCLASVVPLSTHRPEKTAFPLKDSL